MNLVLVFGLLWQFLPATVPVKPGELPMKVAFVVSQHFNMIDFAGPWEVFQDARLPDRGEGPWGKNGKSAFTLYTVSDSKQPIESTAGATLVPKYTFEDAPKPDIVVIGAQMSNSAELLRWLQVQKSNGATLMSVCTGASKLARSGLLDGLPATTHHEYVETFKKSFPKVRWETNRRFVRSDGSVYTAGGLTSGIDLALHVVGKKLGKEAAEGTARYMEYDGYRWTEEER